MTDEKNISGLIHHIFRRLTSSANQKWTDIGYPDIRTTHVSILLRIQAAENNHNVVAKQLGISRQAVSRLNHELIAGGYLEIQATENNKKSETLSLTEKGRRFLTDFSEANLSLEKAFIKIIGAEDFANFKASLISIDKFFKDKLSETNAGKLSK